ncbi:hypothetical protein DERP_001987 [Dermatophagoides pteronyssinus]|uniref:Uncharacterized protein n=1 Tax=Dermatophagoides pteronyssinus TaxID=6956 RepID=A0ABQ8JC43_DERPT|nr:hypothetical protein DERP_001987 [Dermatophagoides pteronyssinus]
MSNNDVIVVLVAKKNKSIANPLGPSCQSNQKKNSFYDDIVLRCPGLCFEMVNLSNQKSFEMIESRLNINNNNN